MASMTALQIAIWSIGFAAIVSVVRALSFGGRERSELRVALAVSLVVASTFALISPHERLESTALFGFGSYLLPALTLCLSLGALKHAGNQGSAVASYWGIAWLLMWVSPSYIIADSFDLGYALSESETVSFAASIMSLAFIALSGLARLNTSATTGSAASRAEPPSRIADALIGGLSLLTLVWITSEYSEVYVSSGAQNAAWLSSVLMLLGLFGGLPNMQKQVIMLCGLFMLVGSHAPL